MRIARAEEDLVVHIILFKETGNVRVEIGLGSMQRLKQADRRMKVRQRHLPVLSPVRHEAEDACENQTVKDSGTDETQDSESHQKTEDSRGIHYLSEYRTDSEVR